MKPEISDSKSFSFWKWLFIGSEAILLCTILPSWIAAYYFDIYIEPASSILTLLLSVIIMAMWLLLLIVSPFFLKSLRWVALFGWIIAFGLFLLGALSPALFGMLGQHSQ